MKCARSSNRRLWNPPLFLIFAMLVALPLAFGQTAHDRYDHYVQAYVRNGDFSGSILVAKGGRILFRKSYGFANEEWNIPNSETTKFHIASVTKTFTAAGITLLERQGKVKFSDSLSKYVPGYLNGDRITIEQMLLHTSGLPDYYSLSEYPAKKYQRVTLPDLIAWVKNKPLDFLPGSKSSYSNTGYGFLAYIIEQVSGRPYHEFISEEILKPANMKETGPFVDDAVIANRANGYQPSLSKSGLRNAPYYDKTILTGSGSLYSTTGDLYLWTKAVASGKFFDVHDSAHVYGWGARRTKSGHQYIEQDGRAPGFASHVSFFPDDELVVIALGNLEDAGVNMMADGLAALALGDSATPPPARARNPEPPPHSEEYAGTYEVNPAFLIDVRAHGSDLYLRGTGGDYLPLEPVGKESFFYRQMYVKVDFKRDKAGKIEALLWNGDYPCKKVSDKPQP